MEHNLPSLLVEKNCSPVTVAETLKMELENFASLMDFCVRTVSRVLSNYNQPHLPPLDMAGFS